MADRNYDGQYGGMPPHARRSDTSKEAAESMLGRALTVRQRVLDAITDKQQYGATTDEIEQILRGSHQTISARVKELRNDGLIVDSGGRRLTRSKRKAAVWIETSFAPKGYVDFGTPIAFRAKLSEPSVTDLRDTLDELRRYWRERDDAGTAPGSGFVRTMQWLASMCPSTDTDKGDVS